MSSHSGEFEKSLNTSFIVIFLKKGGAFIDLTSLVGSIYKIICKVLSSRLKKNSERDRFFLGKCFCQRQLLDATLVANVVIDLRKKEGEHGV